MLRRYGRPRLSPTPRRRSAVSPGLFLPALAAEQLQRGLAYEGMHLQLSHVGLISPADAGRIVLRARLAGDVARANVVDEVVECDVPPVIPDDVVIHLDDLQRLDIEAGLLRGLPLRRLQDRLAQLDSPARGSSSFLCRVLVSAR